MNAWRLAVASLAVAVFASALAQVWVVHQNRKHFAELQRQYAQRDNMNVQWGRLQLEQGTWSTHARIEQVAARELDMRLPGPDDVVIVRR